MVQIKKEIIAKLKKDTKMKLNIAAGLGIGYSTILWRLEKNHELLTTADSLAVISKETGINTSDLLEDRKPTKPKKALKKWHR